jgi:DNA-binding NarL/FixJ family response regulator
VVVFSDREVVALGLSRMARSETGETPAACSSIASLRPALERASIVIVDLAAEQAGEAVALVADSRASLVLVMRDASSRVPAQQLEAADAVLGADELDDHALGFALTAAGSGMRLVPRQLAAPAPVAHHGRPPSPRALGVLAALAEGKRDCEIAYELDITEAAARKMAQRAVHAIGARTRCQAVALAIAAGWVA